MRAAHRFATVVLGILLVTASAHSAAAQERPPEPGTRVRVRVSAPHRQTIVGSVLDWQRQSLQVDVTKPASLAGTRMDLSFANMTRLEVSRGKKSKPLKGALVGGGVGLATGVIVGAIVAPEIDNSDNGSFRVTPFLAGVGLAAGVGIGTLIGAINKGESWQNVSLDKLRVSVLPDSRSRGFSGVLVRFERTF